MLQDGQNPNLVSLPIQWFQPEGPGGLMWDPRLQDQQPQNQGYTVSVDTLGGPGYTQVVHPHMSSLEGEDHLNRAPPTSLWPWDQERLSVVSEGRGEAGRDVGTHSSSSGISGDSAGNTLAPGTPNLASVSNPRPVTRDNGSTECPGQYSVIESSRHPLPCTSARIMTLILTRTRAATWGTDFGV